MEKVKLPYEVIRSADCKQAFAEFFTEKSYELEAKERWYGSNLLKQFKLKHPEYSDCSLPQFHAQIVRWNKVSNIDEFLDTGIGYNKKKFKEIRSQKAQAKRDRVASFIETLDPFSRYTTRQEYEEFKTTPGFEDDPISLGLYRRIRWELRR